MPSDGCAKLSLPSSLVLGMQGAMPAPGWERLLNPICKTGELLAFSS